MIFVIFATILGAIYAYWLYERYNICKYIDKFPGPFAPPLIGNILQVGFTPDEYLKTIRGWFKRFEFKNMRIYVGLQPYIFIPNPETIEMLLSSTTLLYKADIYLFLRPWLGTGLLTAHNPKWHKHRKMITPSFHFQILQDFLQIMNDSTERFARLLDTQYASNGDMFDIQDVITRSTIDIICESAMGTSVNSIEGQPSPLVKAMNDICFVIQDRIFSISKRNNWFFKFTSSYRVHEKALKIMREEISQIIDARRRVLANFNTNKSIISDDSDIHINKRPKMAFLDNLLTATVDGRSLNFQEIFEEVSTFMFEGHDTTASAITFTVYCLSRHPHIQQKAFDEQKQLFRLNHPSQDEKFQEKFKQHSPNMQELQEMKYLELVIKETLRIFPSVPLIARTLELPILIDGKTVPKDTTIVCPIIGVSTDERHFPEPFQFRPERFEADKRSDANPFDYVPFSAGPRNCIGQKFAMMELKVTISKIIRNFEILPAVDGLPSGIHDPSDPNDEPNNPFDPRLGVLVTLKSMNGVFVRLRKRFV